MQSLKDATVVLGVLLLLVSVKVAPLESAGDVIPSAVAASPQIDGGTELAGFASDQSVPVSEQIQFEADTHDCESKIVHVRTLEVEGTGDRIILRIDTHEGQAHVERLEIVEPIPAQTPAPRNAALEASKIG